MELISNIFNTNPGSEFSYYIPLTVLVILLVLSALVFSTIYNNRRKEDSLFKKLFKKTTARLNWFAITLVILLLVRSEGITFLSMRLWLYLTLIALAYFLFRTFHNYFVVYKNEKMVQVSRPQAPKKDEKTYSTKKKRK